MVNLAFVSAWFKGVLARVLRRRSSLASSVKLTKQGCFVYELTPAFEPCLRFTRRSADSGPARNAEDLLRCADAWTGTSLPSA
jgi:hypothetical protein